MTQRCYAFDLDNTLAHFTNGLSSLVDLTVAFGVPRTAAEQILADVSNSHEGFSHRTFAHAVTSVHPHIMPSAFQDAVYHWLADDGIKLYPEALEVLNTLTSDKHTIAVITAGNSEWQSEKLKLLGLQPHHIFVTPPPVGKTSAIVQLMKTTGLPLLYVDDRTLELDRIRDMHNPKEVRLFHIIRDDSIDTDALARHAHERITSLKDVLKK